MDALEVTTGPADEDTSTLEPPSSFLGMNWKLPESGSPSNSKDTDQKLLMESTRRRRIEGAARVPFLGTCPKKSRRCIIETMKIGRDAEWIEWPS